MPNAHLFDGRLALFFESPADIPETSIAQAAGQVRRAAPNVNAIVIRAGQGAGWPDRRLSRQANLAIRSVDDVRRWVEGTARQGLECHAWSVVSGRLVRREVQRLSEICLRGGVRSLLLDLRRGQWAGDCAAARALAAGLRERVGAAFHLGLIFDPRAAEPQALHVQSAWFPEVDSLHPRIHINSGHRPEGPARALAQCYQALAGWGKPIHPVLAPRQLPAAANLAVRVHRAAGLSVFRHGWGGADLRAVAQIELPERVTFRPARRPAAGAKAFSDTPGEAGKPSLVIVDPGNERTGEYVVGYYGDAEQLDQGWTVDHDVNGRPRAYRAATHKGQTLYVGYVPRLTGRGLYAIEVFVPRDHATARDVHYSVVDYPGGTRRESMVVLDQSPHHDVWVPLQAPAAADAPPLSLFELDPDFEDAGRVNVADITFHDPASAPAGGYEISFGAIRWRPTTETPVAPPVGGFDSPVGTEAERAGPFAAGGKIGQYPIWVGRWFDANPFGSRYWLGSRWARHTGADLNLDGGVLMDKDAPVYAIADGRVISAGFVSAGWKNIIIVEHPVPDEGRVVYARYAHVGRMRVRAGDWVRRGQQIAAIGQYAPNNYHLHFDISHTSVLRSVPGHWPGDNLEAVLRDYVDPKEFIGRRHIVQ